MFTKIVRDPLFHFLLLGAAIFAIYGIVKRHSTDKPGEIVVTAGTVENLVTGFIRTWQRPPTEEELRGLVRDYIREEAAYHEALAMGLDRDDMIVRRRLRQKLEFLSDDLASRTQPSDNDLQAFLWAHPELFQKETLFSFQQIYLNPQIHGRNLKRDESRLLNLLQKIAQQPDLAVLGDPFLLPQRFQDMSLSDVKKTFGEQFASGLSRLPIDQWQGPVSSSYGAHFIFLSQRSESYLPALADVRDQVRREWLDVKRAEATDRFYEAILRRYTVKIEPPEEKKVAQVH
ncbi:MAG TPA: peptidyl-prolyl cis-trans isomerase [Candidatus Sulfotelmatobacter sp.]|nr:peptidyl-prolyl cis-trans isomerase [Candidatus Sulfotelmatobacter sp.]